MMPTNLIHFAALALPVIPTVYATNFGFLVPKEAAEQKVYNEIIGKIEAASDKIELDYTDTAIASYGWNSMCVDQTPGLGQPAVPMQQDPIGNCDNLPKYTHIADISFKAPTSDPQSLNISMEGYNLLCNMTLKYVDVWQDSFLWFVDLGVWARKADDFPKLDTFNILSPALYTYWTRWSADMYAHDYASPDHYLPNANPAEIGQAACFPDPPPSLCRHGQRSSLTEERQSHTTEPLIKRNIKGVHRSFPKMLSAHLRLQSSFCINRQADMRTTNLFQFGILAFPTLALTYQVYIYVEHESRYGAKLTGKLHPDGETSEISFGDQGFTESCSNGTSFLTLNRTGTECRDLHTYAGMVTLNFYEQHSDSRPLNISMPGYDLSCNMTVTDQVGDQVKDQVKDQVEGYSEIVTWVVGSGLYTFNPTADLARVGVDCFNVSKES